MRLLCFVDNHVGFVLLWRKNNMIIAVGDQVIDSDGQWEMKSKLLPSLRKESILRRKVGAIIL